MPDYLVIILFIVFSTGTGATLYALMGLRPYGGGKKT